MTNDDVVKNRELMREMVCALADGQLRGQDFAKAVESIHLDTECRAAWQSYHLIGDVLRSADLAEQAADVNFLARFQTRLMADAGAQLAHKLLSRTSAANDVGSHSFGREASANESAFVWKLAAGFASIAAVVAIGWSMVGGLNGTDAGAQLAQGASGVSSAQITPNAQTGPDSAVMIRDPNLDALLAAHKQFGGATALQMASGFLRNATFEGAAR